MVGSSVMVADDRRTTDGIAEKDSDKDKVCVHDRSVGGDTVFAGKLH